MRVLYQIYTCTERGVTKVRPSSVFVKKGPGKVLGRWIRRVKERFVQDSKSVVSYT